MKYSWLHLSIIRINLFSYLHLISCVWKYEWKVNNMHIGSSDMLSWINSRRNKQSFYFILGHCCYLEITLVLCIWCYTQFCSFEHIQVQCSFREEVWLLHAILKRIGILVRIVSNIYICLKTKLMYKYKMNMQYV